jgi:glutamate:GABA antiporter
LGGGHLLIHFGLNVLVPVIALGLVVASVSGLLDWLTGPSTGLLDIGRDRGYLPPFFQQVNANEVQMRILAAQGIVITLIGVLYALVPMVSRAYWIFAALATEVYLIMDLLMFVAAARLRRRQPEHPRGYRAPALTTICVVGALASISAAVIGVLPSEPARARQCPRVRGRARGRRGRDRRAASGLTPEAAQTRVEDSGGSRERPPP